MRLTMIALTFLSAIGSAALAQATPPPNAPPPGCDSPESHQWDFWVGKWEVRPNGADKVIAHSLIEKRYSGCAIRENWMPLGHEVNGGGGSLSIYEPARKLWHQTWIDSSGSRADFDGALADGTLTITGNWASFSGPGKDSLVRMHYRKQPNGEVRQWAEASADGGTNWAPAFDFLYRHIDAFPPF